MSMTTKHEPVLEIVSLKMCCRIETNSTGCPPAKEPLFLLAIV